MSLSVEWDDVDNTILRYTLGSTWTWEEMDVVWQKGAQMTVGITERFDIILDAREMKSFPRDIFEIAPTRYALGGLNGGVSVLVGANTMVRSILDMLILTKPRTFSHFRFADTFEDAYQLITKNRAKTPSG
jgi:hypothetical protein